MQGTGDALGHTLGILIWEHRLRKWTFVAKNPFTNWKLELTLAWI